MIEDKHSQEQNSEAKPEQPHVSLRDEQGAKQTCNSQSNPEQPEQHNRNRLTILERINKAHNLINLLFTGVIAFATIVYVFVSCNELAEMKNGTVLQRHIGKLAYGYPIIVQNAWMGIYHDEPNMWAVVRIQNNGKTEGKFIRLAARMGFRDFDPIGVDYEFNDSDFRDTEPNYLVPYADHGNIANSTNDLRGEIPSMYKGRRLYVWGVITFFDSLGNETKDDGFCRYASQKDFDVFANPKRTAGGFGGPYIDCKPQNKPQDQ